MHPPGFRWVVPSLLAAAVVAGLPGCGSEPPPAPTSGKEFEAAREEYQNIRRSEYRRDSLDPKAKAKPLPKAGG